ncbi:hypothetical protein LBMAG07_08040 [Actinomycetes bacterium]|jgi:hypothetical protein|nr:hypothetical protein LBMAG07_08040 [Actinomycetes bacterium]
MPWCEPCSKYFAPSAVSQDGRCPNCATEIEIANAHGTITAKNLDLKKLAGVDGEEDVPLPWHFKLLVGGLVLYLSWRVIELFR